MIDAKPCFVQGIYDFTGNGFTAPVPLASYTVPADKRAQLIYLRAGNSAAALVTLVVTRDGALLRLFPIGAAAACHVQLAVVEDLQPDTKLDVAVAGPAGVAGTIVLDLGLIEI